MSTTRPPKQKAPALAYAPPAALAAEDLALTDTVGIDRIAVVHADGHGTQKVDAVWQFGLHHHARAIAVIDDSFDDAAPGRMHERGVDGVLTRRVAPLGWHLQSYAEGDKLAEIDDR